MAEYDVDGTGDVTDGTVAPRCLLSGTAKETTDARKSFVERPPDTEGVVSLMLTVPYVPELLVRTAIAIAIGGLIGLERERQPRKYAGLRTLALLCGTAPLVVHIAEVSESVLAVAVYLTLAAALALTIAYIRFVLTGEEVGLTTSVTMFLVAVLGVLVGYGQLFVATAMAIATAFLLAQKKQLQKYVDRLTAQDLADSMKLGALVFILYPILPAEPVGPFGVVNLQEVLLFAIFVLLIEFGSYVSMRQFGGSKGLQVTGLLAGGVNSFATAGVMARLADEHRETLDAASSALLLATIAMIVRNVGIASALAGSILWALWKPTLSMVALAALIGYVLFRQGEFYEESDIELDSPFSLKTAAKFGTIYVAIVLLSVIAREAFGELGLYVTAFVGGLVSSAAVSVSAATVLNNGAVGVEPAASMVLLGIVASLCSKIFLVELLNKRMRLRATVPMAAVGVLGLAIHLLV